MKKIKYYLKIMSIILVSSVSTNIIDASDILNENNSIGKTIAKPKIFFEEQVYDFGKIYISESVNT